MKRKRPDVYIGHDALARFVRFCESRAFSKFFLVADPTTYERLGAAVERELRKKPFEVTSLILDGNELLVDARSILKVLLQYASGRCTFVAAGSGTITDIVRFVSHRSRNIFISLPTAPSVDGYASTNVPMMVDGIKRSFLAHDPAAIFGDMTVLCSAPRAMIAAGFGDMLAKYTSTADWRLGHLLWNAPYSESIARRALAAVDACTDSVAAIGTAAAEGISRLMEALIESGYCMTDFGTSLPASGSEHHFSHYWEMKLLREGRPSILHGSKVGVATVLVSKLYERLRALSIRDVKDLMREAPRPTHDDRVIAIRSAFGPMAEEIVRVQSRFLDLDEEATQHLERKIVDNWSEIQSIAAEVPSPEKLTEALAAAGGPDSPQAIGLSREDVSEAERNARYLRGHFTILRLIEFLNPQGGGSAFFRDLGRSST